MSSWPIAWGRARDVVAGPGAWLAAPDRAVTPRLLSNLQILRAFAALNVVFYHVIVTSRLYGQPVDHMAFLQDWGQSGVDLFFVISGFVMVHVQARAPRSPAAFLAGRITRIAPVYWGLTLFVVALYYLWPAVFRDMPMSWENVLTSLLFVSRWFGHEEPLIYLGWTLEYEMLFYAAFALGIASGDAALRLALVTLILAGAVASGTVGPMAFEFVFGMVIGHLSIRWGRFPNATLLALLGSIALGASIFVETDWDRLLVWGVPAALIVAAAAGARQCAQPLLVLLGDASYSIYLVQILTIAAFYRASPHLLSWVDYDLLALFCLVFTGAFGVVVHLCIERPITALVRTRTIFAS
ncbi:MAG: acyltransferase [Geminicoccaceae bacterium]|nr:acyltransferase [Geminicoccaceae bacterium]